VSAAPVQPARQSQHRVLSPAQSLTLVGCRQSDAPTVRKMTTRGSSGSLPYQHWHSLLVISAGLEAHSLSFGTRCATSVHQTNRLIPATDYVDPFLKRRSLPLSLGDAHCRFRSNPPGVESIHIFDGRNARGRSLNRFAARVSAASLLVVDSGPTIWQVQPWRQALQ
jgi:hypothetical protein